MNRQFEALRNLGSAAIGTVPPRGVQRARSALLASALLALAALAWITWDQMQVQREQALAIELTRAASRLDDQLLTIERRLVRFVDRERLFLDILIADPTDAGRGDTLWSLLKLRFPLATGAVILDGTYDPVASLGTGLGDGDLDHLRRFVRGEAPPVRFVTRGGQLQADFAAAWFQQGEPAGALLLAMRCGALCSSGALSAAAGLDLRLVSASTTDAAASDPDLAPPPRVPIQDTGWVLTSPASGLDSWRILQDRLMLALAVVACFLIAILALYRWIGEPTGSALEEGSVLRESRLKLQAILCAITDGIILTDLKGRIELFNPAAEMMFGRLSEDVIRTNAFKLLPGFFGSYNQASLRQLQSAAHAPPALHETHGRRKGGKEFPVRLLLSSVHFDGRHHLLIVVQDLTEHERNEKHLRFLEQRDTLTGLLNRREFEQRLTAVLADPKLGPDVPHVLCHIDVDQLKLINDTCGHEAGDELLKQLAILIKAKLDVAEIIGRFGGDEFVVLFRNRTAEAARTICDGLIQTVRNFLFTWRDQSFDVAVSIGLSEFTPASEGPSSALSKADVACHMAKTHGRDRIHIYSERDVELVRHHGDMHMVSTISKALRDGRFHLFAQPIAPIAATNSGRRHFEVLVRMEDETGTAVIPDQFIPAAERYILMPAVDRWIINRVFGLQAENLRAWHRIEPDSFLFAINLSGTSIADEGFLHYVKRQFAEMNVPHRSICFEITETAAVSDLARARAFMEELSTLGCSFALDDFGTGFSSYSYLKELPVTYLKIDGSFVRGMSDDPVSCSLVESITQIGHVLGLKTIAEWAEDKRTLDRLRTLKVDFAQGFAVGAPVPVADLTLADAVLPPVLRDSLDDRAVVAIRHP